MIIIQEDSLAPVEETGAILAAGAGAFPYVSQVNGGLSPLYLLTAVFISFGVCFFLLYRFRGLCSAPDYRSRPSVSAFFSLNVCRWI